LTADDFPILVGRVLRRARTSRGLTLRDVAARSRGSFKATAVAGYERGERAISLKRFCELAAEYDIPPQRILAEILRELEGRPRAIVDLTALEAVEGREAVAVVGFVRQVQGMRGDTSSTVTLRAADLEVMATAVGATPEHLLERLAPAFLEEETESNGDAE
jgi:transcriptional regulator with XRE-family HTH domain